MFSEAKVTEIYCMADDFCKEFAKVQGKYMVEDKSHKHRNKPNRMSDAEIMVILILFHDPSLSYACVLQPFCGTGKRSPVAADRFHQGGLDGHLHRHQLRGLHPAACVP